MKTLSTTISINFNGTAKGKRKIIFNSEELAQLEGHVELTQDQFEEYEAIAWKKLDALGYKNANNGSICVNFASEHNGMIIVQLLPKQRNAVVR